MHSLSRNVKSSEAVKIREQSPTNYTVINLLHLNGSFDSSQNRMYRRSHQLRTIRFASDDTVLNGAMSNILYKRRKP